MKINNIQNNNVNRFNSFKAGLTAKIVREISSVSTDKVSRELEYQGIYSDFRNNKVVAWSCACLVNMFNMINKHTNQKLALPKGIYICNFDNLNIQNSSMYGFCNLVPVKLYKNSEKIVPEQMLFFNENLLNEKWENINEISDKRFFEKESATDHFLDIFAHEFFHAVHEANLKKVLSPKTLIKKLQSCNNETKLKTYRDTYGDKVSTICERAVHSPLEAVACDMSRILLNNLDNNFKPKVDMFIGTPYEHLSFLQRILLPRYSSELIPLTELLRNFWNGKF